MDIGSNVGDNAKTVGLRMGKVMEITQAIGPILILGISILGVVVVLFMLPDRIVEIIGISLGTVAVVILSFLLAGALYVMWHYLSWFPNMGRW